MRQLKYLPWGSLVGVAAITILGVWILDYLLLLGFAQPGPLQQVLLVLFNPIWVTLTLALVGVGIGALGVLLLEKLAPQIVIQGSILWALILCLLVGLVLKSLLPLSGLIIVGVDRIQLVGVLVGVFWKGRRYWR